MTAVVVLGVIALVVADRGVGDVAPRGRRAPVGAASPAHARDPSTRGGPPAAVGVRPPRAVAAPAEGPAVDAPPPGPVGPTPIAAPRRSGSSTAHGPETGVGRARRRAATSEDRVARARRGRRMPPRRRQESAKSDARRRETMVFADEAGRADARHRLRAPPPARRSGARLPGRGRPGPTRRTGPRASDEARRRGGGGRRRRRVGVGIALASAGGPAQPAACTTHRPRPITAAGRGAPTHHGAPRADLIADSRRPRSAPPTRAPSSPYTVAIDASAPCWVMATRPGHGQGGVDRHHRRGGIALDLGLGHVWSSSSAPPATPA